jgi:LmbE family N-acetylglucosaminyl deacetylase
MKLIAFYAHPDDETLMNGGTLALLTRAGVEVHYLCATRGEGGENGEPPLCTIEELGRVRSAEMACAVQALGGASLSYLEYIDPRVGPDNQLYAYTDDLPALAQKVADAARRLGADALITHGSNGEYGHPAHVVSHRAALLAVEMMGEAAPHLYTGVANFPNHPRPRLVNKDDPAHLILDITLAVEQKVQGMLCHRTQNALFVRRASQEAGRQMTVPEVVLRVESLRRVHPLAQGELDDEMARLLAQYRIPPPAGV